MLHTKISPFPCMQDGTCGTENCDGRGLMYSVWPIRVGWVAGSGWMPTWLTNADQSRSAHAEPGSQSNQPQSAPVTCGSPVKSVSWIWSLRPGCSKVSWDLWNGTIGLPTLMWVASDILNDSFQLDNELSAWAATCSSRSVTEVTTKAIGLHIPL